MVLIGQLPRWTNPFVHRGSCNQCTNLLDNMGEVISKSKSVVQKTVFDFATLLLFRCVIYINTRGMMEHIEDSELIARI
jgi:hypothetical protein